MTIHPNLDYTNKKGFEITTGRGVDRYVEVRRFNEAGEFETLFCARFKYGKPGTKANRHARRLLKRFGGTLQTITKAELDAFRAEMYAIGF
tara:strand:+ start:1840 stop:2112 length:273 start_codon:yes stop_codon:yes gene_type:complete